MFNKVWKKIWKYVYLELWQPSFENCPEPPLTIKNILYPLLLLYSFSRTVASYFKLWFVSEIHLSSGSNNICASLVRTRFVMSAFRSFLELTSYCLINKIVWWRSAYCLEMILFTKDFGVFSVLGYSLLVTNP